MQKTLSHPPWSSSTVKWGHTLDMYVTTAISGYKPGNRKTNNLTVRVGPTVSMFYGSKVVVLLGKPSYYQF